jgi:hypothetical protein
LSGNKNKIDYSLNGDESDTIIIDLGTICLGQEKDTTITIYNKSTFGSTFIIDKVDTLLEINNLDKAEKNHNPTPIIKKNLKIKKVINKIVKKEENIFK